MDQSTGDLIKRLSRLELQQARLQRSNKHLRMMTSAMLLLCGALFTMAQTSTVTETVEAQQFLLRDSTGSAVASLVLANAMVVCCLVLLIVFRLAQVRRGKRQRA